MLLVGSFAMASAEAQGPVWYHKLEGAEGKGVKITGQKPEEVQGGGGEQKLEATIAGIAVQIIIPQVQVKGIIYNNGLQGQAKITLVYGKLRLVNPPMMENCQIELGNPQNTVKMNGHQAWKWDGMSSTQLNEQPVQQQRPDWIFMSSSGEITQGVTSIPEIGVTSLIFKTNCGVFNGITFNIKGSVAASIVPVNLGEFSKKQTATMLTPGTQSKQHFWNGSQNVGGQAGLVGRTGTEQSAPIKLTGSFELKLLPNPQTGEQQEVALFEN
jgi:hypothetical protein